MDKLGLISPADRRVEVDLGFLHIILIDGRVDAPSLLSKINFWVPSHTARSKFHFFSVFN